MNHKKNKTTRSLFWTSAAFYGLVALEFFYMFSPFAAYFYGVYGPGLEILNASDSTSWLIRFFMPHIVRETKSFWINWHEIIGGIFFAGGLTGFVVGAIQIYWSKLTRKGEAVSEGIYQRIRHPQYLALMAASFGMVLIWPRYLVLFGFITICFAYFFLARIEEKICRNKFPGYIDYCKKTGMFLPQRIERIFRFFPRSQKRIWKFCATLGLYLFLLITAFGIARFIHSQSVKSLYTYSQEREIYVSLGHLEENEIAFLVNMAQENSEVQNRLGRYQLGDYRLINYVMPAELMVSEVPMFIPEGQTPSHQSPSGMDQSRYKIIYTVADFGPREPVNGSKILLRAVNKSSILEVWINRKSGNVEKIFNAVDDPYYSGMPVPVF